MLLSMKKLFSLVNKDLNFLPAWIRNYKELYLAWRNKEDSLKKRLEQIKSDELVRRNTKVIFDKRPTNISEHELTLVSLFKNGAYYLPAFLRHYKKMGVRHMIFLDNGSSDHSYDILSKEENVTLLHTSLPFKGNHKNFRRSVIREFCKGKWSLTVDIDELWDYPYSEKIPLKDLLVFLNSRGYTGMQSIMLDMFSNIPLNQLPDEASDDLLSTYPYFSNEGLIYKKTKLKNHMAVYGGVNNCVFGMKDICLSKIPLIKWSPVVNYLPKDAHFSDFLNIPSITSVLYHFRFNNHFYEKVNTVVREENYANGSKHYKLYAEFLKEKGELRLFNQNSRKLDDTKSLLDAGIMKINEDFRQEFAL